MRFRFPAVIIIAKLLVRHVCKIVLSHEQSLIRHIVVKNLSPMKSVGKWSDPVFRSFYNEIRVAEMEDAKVMLRTESSSSIPASLVSAVVAAAMSGDVRSSAIANGRCGIWNGLRRAA